MRPWRLGFIVLYMGSNGGKTARLIAKAGQNETGSAVVVF
jgi:hypothetical protein